MSLGSDSSLRVQLENLNIYVRPSTIVDDRKALVIRGRDRSALRSYKSVHMSQSHTCLSALASWRSCLVLIFSTGVLLLLVAIRISCPSMAFQRGSWCCRSHFGCVLFVDGHLCSFYVKFRYPPALMLTRQPGADSALNVFMDVRRTDREASLASVAGELEMEEQGDGAKLLKSKASAIHARFGLLPFHVPPADSFGTCVESGSSPCFLFPPPRRSLSIALDK